LTPKCKAKKGVCDKQEKGGGKRKKWGEGGKRKPHSLQLTTTVSIEIKERKEGRGMSGFEEGGGKCLKILRTTKTPFFISAPAMSLSLSFPSKRNNKNVFQKIK
jgi:hypothetical protein